MRQGFLFDFEKLEYKRALNLQRKLVELRMSNHIPECLILLEHEHVFTIGKRGSEKNIFDKSIPYYYVERGGDVTYHGPGQLVGYLIFDLKKLKLDVKEYVKKIENSICYMLKKFTLYCDSEHKMPGVWFRNKKVASIGIALKNFITFHGFALNVNTDLSYFNKIKPCGLDSTVMTSMERELGYKVNINLVKEHLIEGFKEEFDINFTKKNIKDLKLEF